MNLFNLSPAPGAPAEWYGVGRYLRLLSGVGELRVRVMYDRDQITSAMLPGIGIDLSHPDTGERFKGFIIESDSAQTVQVLVTEFPTTDNRQDLRQVALVANSGISGQPERVLGAGAAQVAANLTRKKIYLSAPDTNVAPIWVGATAANNGMPLEPGDVLLLDVTGALDYIGTAGDKLHVIEVV